MKITFSHHHLSQPCRVLGQACLTLLLAVQLARAQTTNAPAAAGPTDVSQFPSLDKLPGRVPPHVWTGLANGWAQNHARWKRSATNDPGAVVFLGDSITQGWNTLAADFPTLKVANRGIGGDISSGVLYRLQADVLDLHPAGIVLLIGTNDIGDGAKPEDVAENLRLILEEINHYNPKLKVILCKIMPTQDGQPNVEKIKQANDLVAQMVKSNPNVVVCDTFGAFLDDQNHQLTADFNGDHLHLNHAGYTVWKAALDPIVAQLGWAAAK
jgi:lysophospholipase L1-like esterase